MSMRKNKLGTTLLLSALTVGSTALVGGDQNLAVKTDSEMLEALDNSIWIPDGKVAEKQVYILAAPWCGVCQKLYQTSAAYRNRVQFRWIETGAADATSEEAVAEAAMLRNISVLDRMYGTLENPKWADPALRENALRYNSAVETAVREAVDKLIGRRGGYPTIIWLANDRVHVLAGMPTDLSPVVNSAVARPEAAAIVPRGVKLLNAHYMAETVPHEVYRMVRDGVEMFALPDASSQLVARINKGVGYWAIRRATVDEEGWIELQYYKDTPRGYFVRERDVERRR